MSDRQALDLLEAALARAVDLSNPEDLEPIRRLMVDIRARPGFPGRALVVAIAGGTGTGKSSLLNALAGASIAPVGPRRPTTDRPLAWVPPSPSSSLAGLLDSLGVEARVEQEEPSQIAIIDLPDFDSTEEEHRAIVEELVRRVDAVIWVADPEKYNDRILHRGLLEALARYQEQYLFVLNQIDLLEDPIEVAAHWEDLLMADGIAHALVVRTAARPLRGPPIGIEAVQQWIDRQLQSKQTLAAKLAADLMQAIDVIEEATGAGPGTDLGFESGWSEARREAALFLTLGASRRPSPGTGAQAAVAAARHPLRVGDGRSEGIAEATHVLSRYVSRLATAAGPRLGQRLLMSFPPAVVRTVCESLGSRLDPSLLRNQKAWKSAGAVQYLWGGSALVCFGALAVLGSEVASTAVAGLGLVGVGSVEWWLRRSGSKAGAKAADEAAEAQREVKRALDRIMGTPLRAVLRPRAELTGLLSRLAIVAARMDSG